MVDVRQKLLTAISGVANGLRRRPARALLSVIVPVYNTEEFLDECLHSIRTQHHRRIEIIVVDDGSTDSSVTIAKRHAVEDRRVQLIRQANAGVSVARNVGVASARGSYLTFVDADDTVTEDGFARAVVCLEATGSDLAVLKYQRIRDGKIANPARWIRALHKHDRLQTDLVRCPEMMVNAAACAKVYRHDFWQREHFAFTAGMLYEDQLFTVQTYLAANSVDVLANAGYNWRVRESSISQGHASADNLRALLDATLLTLDTLAALPSAREERALQKLCYDMTISTLKLERADDEYLSVLIDRLPLIVDLVPRARFLAEVPVQFRVLYELICQGKRQAVWSYVQAEGMQLQMQATGLEPGGFSAYLPGWQRDGLEAETYVLCADQTPLKTRVLDVSKTSSGVLNVAIEAYIQNVDFAEFVPDIRVSLAGAACALSRSPHAATVTSRQNAVRRYADSGWAVAIEDAGRLDAKSLVVQIDVAAGPFERSGRLRVDIRHPSTM